MGTATIQGELWGHAPQDWAKFSEPTSRPLWEAMLDETHVGTGTRILDAGCGGGGASELAAQRGAHVSGIDATPGLIAYARERLPDGDFRVGDIEELPYADATFDVVFAANSLQYAENRVATLRQFARVCRPDGRVVAGLFGAPDQVEFRAIFGAVRRALPAPPPGAGPFELSMPGVLEALFAEAGLTVLKSGEVNCPFHYADFATFWRANAAAGPMQGMMRIIGREQLKSVLRAAIAPYMSSDGSITIQPNSFKYVVATP